MVIWKFESSNTLTGNLNVEIFNSLTGSLGFGVISTRSVRWRVEVAPISPSNLHLRVRQEDDRLGSKLTVDHKTVLVTCCTCMATTAPPSVGCLIALSSRTLRQNPSVTWPSELHKCWLFLLDNCGGCSSSNKPLQYPPICYLPFLPSTPAQTRLHTPSDAFLLTKKKKKKNFTKCFASVVTW